MRSPTRAMIPRFVAVVLLAGCLPRGPVPAALRTSRPLDLQDSLTVERAAYDAVRTYANRMHAMRTASQADRASHELWTALAEYHALLPNDEWINSMLVWNRPSNAKIALEAISGCLDWWCALLRVAIQYPNARTATYDSLIDAAVALMPPAVRCVWDDASSLLPGGGERWSSDTCADRAEFNRRLWWLADPLYSVPGNERRTEQFVRQVTFRLQSEWRIVDRIAGYAFASQETARVGRYLDVVDDAAASEEPPPERGEAARTGATFLSIADRVVALYAGRRVSTLEWDRLDSLLRRGKGATARVGDERVSFVPSVRAIEAPFAARPDDWQLYPRRAADVWETGVSLAGAIAPLEWQSGYLLRGDSARLIIASSLRDSDLLAAGPLTAFVAVTRAPDDPPRLFERQLSRYEDRLIFAANVARDSAIVSLEVFSSRGAGRVRAGGGPPAMPPGGRIALSDVFFYRPRADASDGTVTASDILPLLLPAARIIQGTELGVYFEMYGLRAGERLRLTLSVQPESSPGVALRLANVLFGAALEPVPVRVVLEDRGATGASVEGRGLRVSIGALQPGKYRLRLTAAAPGEIAVGTERTLTVVARE